MDSPKSRVHWAYDKISDEDWKRIFGHTDTLKSEDTGTKKDKPGRGDYPLCREVDKTLKDYGRFKGE